MQSRLWLDDHIDCRCFQIVLQSQAPQNGPVGFPSHCSRISLQTSMPFCCLRDKRWIPCPMWLFARATRRRRSETCHGTGTSIFAGQQSWHINTSASTSPCKFMQIPKTKQMSLAIACSLLPRRSRVGPLSDTLEEKEAGWYRWYRTPELVKLYQVITGFHGVDDGLRVHSIRLS